MKRVALVLLVSAAAACSNGDDASRARAAAPDAATAATDATDATSAAANDDGGAPPVAVPDASAQPVEMTWLSVPTQPVTPGLVADPDPTSIQDDGLNSSVVIRVTRNGQPVVGEDVAFTSDDATSGIQTLTTKSDGEGRVRAWYFAGKQPQQQIVARHVGTNQTLTTSVARALAVSPTVGRYAATYYRAPAGQYSEYAVSLIPKAAPERTYYQVSSVWRKDGSFALYGGLQMTDCNALVDASPAVVAACDVSKGTYRGRTALFSSWDWKTPAGATVTPILVSAPSATHCRSFGGEGTGLQCFAPVSWDVGEEWRWTLQLLGGALPNYQRVRVVLANATKGTQEIATVDVGGALDINTVSAFNENWGGAPASSCLDVALRSMSIVRMGFWDGTQWVKPASGKGMGGLYDDTMTRCENYAFSADATGLTIASGGVGTWIGLADALVLDPATQKRVLTADQLLWQWQTVDVSTIGLPN